MTYKYDTKANVTGMKKTNLPGYYKDPKTGVIVNTNDDQLRSYYHGRQTALEFNTLKQNYTRLEDELTQIKKALGI